MVMKLREITRNQRSKMARRRARGRAVSVRPQRYDAKSRSVEPGGERGEEVWLARAKDRARENCFCEIIVVVMILLFFKLGEERDCGCQGVDEGVDVAREVVKVEAGASAPGNVEVTVEGLSAVVTAATRDSRLV